MTNKNYKFGKYNFKSYYKATGQGWEIGLCSGNEYYFVGNFIHEREAKKWWGAFNKHIGAFARKYDFVNEASRGFYGEFMGAYLYKEYYRFVSGVVQTHHNQVAKGLERFNKQWTKYSKAA